MDRDENAARNILGRGLGTVGHTATFAPYASNAWGDETSTLSDASLPIASYVLEPRIPVSSGRGVSKELIRVSCRDSPQQSIIAHKRSYMTNVGNVFNLHIDL